jgi:hypothetical protein
VVYLLWILALGVLGGIRFGWPVGTLLVAAAPLVGLAGLLVRERWRGSWRDARRWLLLRSRRRLVDGLVASQCELAGRLDRLHQRLSARDGAGGPEH